MPETSDIVELAKRFSNFHNRTVTKAQAIMIEDGMPAEIVLKPQEERNAAWRGIKTKPTASMRLAGDEKKIEDAGTLQLLKEKAAAERAAKAKKTADKKERKIIKAKLKTHLKPRAAESAEPQETETMTTKTAKKASKPAAKKVAKKAAAPKAAAKKAVAKKAATEKARTPVGERSRYDWKAAEERAAEGKVPTAPDFSAPTHARFLPTLKEIKDAVAAKDVKALKAIKISPISSTPKAMDRFRKLCVKALEAGT